MFLGIVGQDPSDSKPNWLHFDIFRFCFLHSFEVYSIDSFKRSVKSPKVLNPNWLFLELNWFIFNKLPVLLGGKGLGIWSNQPIHLLLVGHANKHPTKNECTGGFAQLARV